MELENKSTVCRVCLKWEPEETTKCYNIFDEYNNFTIYEELNTIANVHIKPRDGLPDRICSLCIKELENVVYFKQKCLYSNSLLLSTAVYENSQQIEAKTEEISGCDDGYPEEVFATTIESEETHNKSKISSYQCDDCGEFFKSKCKLNVHWKRVHLPFKLTCTLCKRQFKSFKSFNTHKKKNSKSCFTASLVRIEGEGKSRTFFCKDCEYSTFRIKDMSAHLLIHTGERPYSCTLCTKTFKQLSTLQAHQEIRHKNYIKESTCHICGKHIKGRGKIYKHMITHRAAEFKCDICNIVVKSRRTLNNHIRRHSELKSYFCETCPARFYTLSELCNHRSKVHNKTKQHKCEICGYSSYYRCIIIKHKSKHIGNNVACNVCGKFFESDTQLIVHRKCHFEKNHSCSQCVAKFSSRKSLLKHVKFIHGIIPIRKDFKFKSDLEPCVVKKESS